MKFITTEKDIVLYAIKCAETIVIRTYEDGSSIDTRRQTTQKESEILANLIAGALYTVLYHSGNNNLEEHRQTI